jgi:proteasome lid subunit RPN8/RPN11
MQNRTPINPTEIRITRPLAIQLLALAQQAPLYEICGLVGAVDALPVTVYPTGNTAINTDSAFEMDPQDQIRALKTMREKGETLFAIYHSHPHSPPAPSTRDLENIGYPDAYQLIISLNIKGVLEMRAYKLTVDGLREIELLL